MLNSVLIGFLGQVDLEQHNTKDSKVKWIVANISATHAFY